MSFVSMQTNEPSKKELAEAVKEVYKEKAKKEKEVANVGKEKKKREPSAYNNYYKQKAAEIKDSEKSLPKEERMTAKEMMSYIAKLWQDEKNSENYEDAEDELHSQVSPVEPKKKGKKSGK